MIERANIGAMEPAIWPPADVSLCPVYMAVTMAHIGQTH